MKVKKIGKMEFSVRDARGAAVKTVVTCNFDAEDIADLFGADAANKWTWEGMKTYLSNIIRQEGLEAFKTEINKHTMDYEVQTEVPVDITASILKDIKTGTPEEKAAAIKKLTELYK